MKSLKIQTLATQMIAMEPNDFKIYLFYIVTTFFLLNNASVEVIKLVICEYLDSSFHS